MPSGLLGLRAETTPTKVKVVDPTNQQYPDVVRYSLYEQDNYDAIEAIWLHNREYLAVNTIKMGMFFSYFFLLFKIKLIYYRVLELIPKDWNQY